MTSHHHNNNQQPHHAGGLYARQAGGFDNRRAAGAAELSSSMNGVVGPPGTLPKCSETTAASLKPYDKTTQPKTTMKMPNHAVVSDEEGPFPIIQAEAATPRMLKTWAAHSSNAMAAPRVHFSGTTSQHAVPRSPPTSNKKKKASRVARTSPGRPSKQAVRPRTSKVSSIKKKLDAPPTPDAHPVSVVTKKKPAVPSKTPVATTSSPQKRCFSPSSSHKSSSGGNKLGRVDFASLECRTTPYSVAPSTSNSLAGPQNTVRHAGPQRQERPIFPTRSSEPRPEPDQCEQTNQDIGWKMAQVAPKSPIVPTRSSEPRPEPDDLYYFPPAPTAKPMSKFEQFQHDIAGNLGPRHKKITAGILRQVVQRGAEKLAAESTKPAPPPKTPVAAHRKGVDMEALVANVALEISQQLQQRLTEDVNQGLDVEALVATIATTVRDGFEISQQLQQRLTEDVKTVNQGLGVVSKRVDAHEQDLQVMKGKVATQQEQLNATKTRLDELEDVVADVVAALSTKKKPRRSSNGTRAAPRSAKKTGQSTRNEVKKTRNEVKTSCKKLNEKMGEVTTKKIKMVRDYEITTGRHRGDVLKKGDLGHKKAGNDGGMVIFGGKRYKVAKQGNYEELP